MPTEPHGCSLSWFMVDHYEKIERRTLSHLIIINFSCKSYWQSNTATRSTSPWLGIYRNLCRSREGSCIQQVFVGGRAAVLGQVTLTHHVPLQEGWCYGAHINTMCVPCVDAWRVSHSQSVGHLVDFDLRRTCAELAPNLGTPLGERMCNPKSTRVIGYTA